MGCFFLDEDLSRREKVVPGGFFWMDAGGGCDDDDLDAADFGMMLVCRL